MQKEQQPSKCEHGVVGEYCFNCRFKEKYGMKIEMFNGHHYVRLKDVESHLTALGEEVMGAIPEEFNDVDSPLAVPEVPITVVVKMHDDLLRKLRTALTKVLSKYMNK